MTRRLVWGLVTLLWVGGCLGRSEYTPIRYYSIESGMVLAPRAERVWPVTLGIRSLTAPTRYRDRILYRASEVEVGYYEYERWVEPPEEMVTGVLRDFLRASGLFPRVVSAEEVDLPAWMLSGELTRFDEVRGADGNRAECAVRLELRRARDEHLLWSEVIRAVMPLAAESPAALAQAMSLAVQEVAHRLMLRLQNADMVP